MRSGLPPHSLYGGGVGEPLRSDLRAQVSQRMASGAVVGGAVVPDDGLEVAQGLERDRRLGVSRERASPPATWSTRVIGRSVQASHEAESESPVKELIIVRHAQSSWKDSSLDDRDRPLNKRRERDAPEMGAGLPGAFRFNADVWAVVGYARAMRSRSIFPSADGHALSRHSTFLNFPVTNLWSVLEMRVW